MTQKALATELHMCQNTISRYETGGWKGGKQGMRN